MIKDKLIATGNNNNPANYFSGVLPDSNTIVFMNGFGLIFVDDTVGVAGLYSTYPDTDTGAVQHTNGIISCNLPLILNFRFEMNVAITGGFVQFTSTILGQVQWTGGFVSVAAGSSIPIRVLGTNPSSVVLTITDWVVSSFPIHIVSSISDFLCIINCPSDTSSSNAHIGNQAGGSNANMTGTLILNSSYFDNKANNGSFLSAMTTWLGTVIINGEIKGCNTQTSCPFYIETASQSIANVVISNIDLDGGYFPIGGKNYKFKEDNPARGIKVKLTNNIIAKMTDIHDVDLDKVVYPDGNYHVPPKEAVSLGVPVGVDEVGEAIFTVITD